LLLSQSGTAGINSIVPSTTAGPISTSLNHNGTLSNSHTVPSTTAPVFGTLLKTTSGTTVTQIIIPFLGKSTSGITLVPVLTGILHSTDPAATSTAGILGGKLTKVKDKVQNFQKNPKIGPPTGFLEDT
jgi:hypothetical protein